MIIPTKKIQGVTLYLLPISTSMNVYSYYIMNGKRHELIVSSYSYESVTHCLILNIASLITQF